MLAKTFFDEQNILPSLFTQFFDKLGFRSLLLTLIALCAFGTTTAMAQSYQGALRGALHDATGNALPSATMTLTNTATNLIRVTTTNSTGEYFFEKVDPGKYKLDASVAGFKKLERGGIIIETQQQITLDLVMEIGNVAETVVITDEVPLIESANASVGQVITKQFLSDLPNSGRNPFSLAAISPNYIPAGNPTFNRQQDQSGSSQISLAGGPVRGNNYLLDGVPIADIGNRAVIIPTFEAIQELKMQVNNYDAEAGRTGGGIFNVSARSGSNQLHGSLFGFLRPNPLQSNNFFNNRNGIKRPDADYGLYGGSVGGPVYIPKIYNGKDKTFFWIAMEGYRIAKSFLSETFTVPTELERQGDFSQTKNGRAGGGHLQSADDAHGQRPVSARSIPKATSFPSTGKTQSDAPCCNFSRKRIVRGDASGRNNYAATQHAG
jgi:Cna protein B-type domain.